MADGILDVKPFVESPETDLEQRGRLATGLTTMLADAYVLMVKTQGFHWNVVGPLFVSCSRWLDNRREQERTVVEAA